MTYTALSQPEATVVSPTLIFDQDAWNMLHAYVQGVPTEINGFAYVQQVSASAFMVRTSKDVFITKQAVTGSEALVSGDAYAKALSLAMTDDRDDDLKLQWHSHVNGAAYCSGTDMATIEDYGRAGADWFISVVTNKRGDVFARLDLFSPFRLGTQMTVALLNPTPEEYRDRAMRQIDELVSVKPPEKTRTVRRVGSKR